MVRLAPGLRVFHLRLDGLLARVEVLHANEAQAQHAGVRPPEINSFEYICPREQRVATDGRIGVGARVEAEDADHVLEAVVRNRVRE